MLWWKAAIGAGCFALAGVAIAQVAFAPLDPSAFDTPDQRNAAIAASIASATPSDCPPPLSDGLTATAGIQPRCMPRQDAQRASVIQATMVTTASDGTFTGNWAVPFASSPTGRSATVEIPNGTSAPYLCSFYSGSVTATGFTGRCFQIVATTLPATLAAVLGLTINPITNAAGGLTVRVVGRQ